MTPGQARLEDLLTAAAPLACAPVGGHRHGTCDHLQASTRGKQGLVRKQPCAGRSGAHAPESVAKAI